MCCFEGLVDELRYLLDEEIKGAPSPVNRYYRKCRDKQGDRGKEYCARVAWSIYCAHKNPEHGGCTKYGKKWGRPYSGPISGE